MTPTLTQRLATSATGYGAVIDGIMNVQTVTDSPNRAALNALYVSGVHIQSNCRDPDCDCMVKALAKLKPAVTIVAVKIEVMT